MATSSLSKKTNNTKTREEEQEEYRKECDKYVNSGLTKNVTVQFLLERLINMGCTPPKGFIRCMDCGDKMAGGGFGVVEETVLPPSTFVSSNDGADSNADKDARERQKRAEKPQCDRTLKDLQDQIDAQNRGKVTLRLLPEIFLCQQHLVNEQHAHQSMVHELIHAIDLCR